MAPQPKPTPFEIDGPGGTVIAWASDTAALQSFFPGATPLTETLQAAKQVSYSGYSRRQYPGDASTVGVSGGSRQVYPERWLAGNTTPGTRFYCETKVTGSDGKPKTRRKQFTYQGAFGDLKAAARAQTVVAYVLRNASGAAYQIGVPPPVPPALFHGPEIVEP
jgi:hypothetical protein